MRNPLTYLREQIEASQEADYSDWSEPDKVLIASELRDLLIKATCASVRICAAIIRGQLDLSWSGSSQKPLPALCFRRCKFEPDGKPIDDTKANLDLSDAHVEALSLEGSELTHLRAVRVSVHGSVDLSELGPLGKSDEALCWCKLSCSTINGDLLADGVNLRAPAKSGAGFQYSNLFEWNWGLNVCASRIGGAVVIRDAKSGRLPVVRGGLLMDAANVGGDIYIRTAKIACLEKRYAISLERSRVAGSVTLAGVKGSSECLECTGTIWMMGSQIGGSFDMYGVEVTNNASGLALYAVGARIGNRLTLGQQNDGAVGANCRIWVVDTQVGGNLEVTNLTITQCGDILSWLKHRESDVAVAIDLRGTRITGALIIRDNSVGAENVDLRGTHCRSLDDAPCGYKGARFIMLDGFRYDHVNNADWGHDIEKRLKWLPSDPEHESSSSRSPYSPQPFIQLSSVLAAHGNDADAWRVLSKKSRFDAKKRWKLQPLPLGLHRIWYAALYSYGFFFNFGLSPIRALGTLGLFIMFGAGLFGVMDHRNALVIVAIPATTFVKEKSGTPEFASTKVPTVGNLRCGLTQDLPLQPLETVSRLLIYSTDAAIPLFDLHEEEKCEIGQVENTVAPPKSWEVTIYRCLRALYTVVGWILTTLAVITFSGVMRQRIERE